MPHAMLDPAAPPPCSLNLRAKDIAVNCLRALDALQPLADEPEVSGLVALAAVTAYVDAVVATETAPKPVAPSSLGSRKGSASRLPTE